MSYGLRQCRPIRTNTHVAQVSPLIPWNLRLHEETTPRGVAEAEANADLGLAIN